MGRVLFSLAVIEQDFSMSIAVLSSIPSWRVLEGLGEEDFAVGDFDAVVEVLGLGEGEVGLGVGVEEVGTGVGEEIDGVGAGETLVLEERHRKNARRSTRTATTAIHTYRGPLLNDERGAGGYGPC